MNNVIFMQVKVFRNVKDYKFVPKLETSKQQEIEEKIASILGSNFHKIDLTKADAGIIEYLRQNSLIGRKTKVLYADKKQAISISLFEDEHITIRVSANEMQKSAIKSATELANKLASKISMSYNDEYGYLTSNLTHIGTGLQLECDIDLNSILKLGKIEQIKQNIKHLGFNLTEKEPNIFTLSTTCNLGFTEKEIIEDFEKTVAKLEEVELESAKMLFASNHDEILDMVLRSNAILTSAYRIGADELKHRLSDIRTGINLNLIDFKVETLNKIQKLVTNKNSQIASQSELVELAEKVKNIIKGE